MRKLSEGSPFGKPISPDQRTLVDVPSCGQFTQISDRNGTQRNTVDPDEPPLHRFIPRIGCGSKLCRRDRDRGVRSRGQARLLCRRRVHRRGGVRRLLSRVGCRLGRACHWSRVRVSWLSLNWRSGKGSLGARRLHSRCWGPALPRVSGLLPTNAWQPGNGGSRRARGIHPRRLGRPGSLSNSGLAPTGFSV